MDLFCLSVDIVKKKKKKGNRSTNELLDLWKLILHVNHEIRVGQMEVLTNIKDDEKRKMLMISQELKHNLCFTSLSLHFLM